eukprot:292936_1
MASSNRKQNNNRDSKRDEFSFYCRHELKDINRNLFIKYCMNREKMQHIKPPSNAPKSVIWIGFCTQCAVDLFIETDYCSQFENYIPSKLNYSKSTCDLQKFYEFQKFVDTSYFIRLFINIVAVPPIFCYINSKKVLFTRYLKFMLQSDDYLREWKEHANQWVSYPNQRPRLTAQFNDDHEEDYKKYFEHLQDHIVQESFSGHEKLEKIFNVLYHNGMTLKHLEWILCIDDGKFFVQHVVIKFLSMMKYKEQIDIHVDPPWDIYYFSIYVSIFIFKYKSKINTINQWNIILDSPASKITYKYYGFVLTVFSSKRNKMKKVYKQQVSNYINDIIEYRDRILCNNPKCRINFYYHKYDTHSFSNEMWDRYKSPLRKWYKCSKCKIVYYCSRKCQKYDWNKYNHKILCNKFV